METKVVAIEKLADMNFVLGQSHFIKTMEDLKVRKGFLRKIGYKL